MNLKKNVRTEEKWGFAAIEEAVRTAVKHAYWGFLRETDLDSEELGRSQESARPKDLLPQRYVLFEQLLHYFCRDKSKEAQSVLL